MYLPHEHLQGDDLLAETGLDAPEAHLVRRSGQHEAIGQPPVLASLVVGVGHVGVEAARPVGSVQGRQQQGRLIRCGSAGLKWHRRAVVSYG